MKKENLIHISMGIGLLITLFFTFKITNSTTLPYNYITLLFGALFGTIIMHSGLNELSKIDNDAKND